MLIANAHAAANLLVNGNFNQPLAGTWNTWTYGGGWAGASSTAAEEFDGSVFVYMGGNDAAGGGVNQVLFAQPGIPYTASCVSAVTAWWWPAAEMRLIFLDAADAELLRAATNCAAGITGYDTGLGWSDYSFTVTSPPGTVKVKVEFACPAGHGTVRFDNAVLTAPLVYPEIQSVYPDGLGLMQATNTLAFTAASTATAIPDGGIQVILNGLNVSPSLQISGSSLSKQVRYAGLATNKTYNVSIQVMDAGGLISARTFRFDTFSPNYYTWEAEDYDFNAGQYVDNPQTNAYFDLTGAAEIDFHDTSAETGNHGYRSRDVVGTEATTDVLRSQYAGINDYNVGWFDANEWLNYTRTLPPGIFNVYARMSSPGVSTMNLSLVTGGQGTTDQTLTSLGNFLLEGGLGWGSYSWVPLIDGSGNMVKVTLGGLTTLRATAGGNANAQFFMLVPANNNVPTITAIYPSGATLFQNTNTVSFTANSAAGVNSGSIQVTLSVTNPTTHYTTNLTSTNGLVISGTPGSRVVSYPGLIPNTTYDVVITVTDINNNTVSVNPRFDTYAPGLVWEAEDWDFNGGQFISNPGVDAYANQSGYEGIDYHDVNGTGGHPYRPLDLMSADVILDTPRPEWLAVGGTNYAVGYFTAGEWINYTRSFPAGSYNIYGRFSAGDGTSVESLSVVTNGAGTGEQSSRALGVFTIPNSGGWGTYRWTPLRDEFGNLASVPLAGVSTLKAQRVSGSDANNNLYMILPAETGLPTITQVTPVGWMQSTNRLRFVASSLAGIATSNVVVRLNNVAVTNLSFSGSATSWAVSCFLAPSTVYTAVISLTDANNLSATTTVNFDTFSPAGYTWEAEDFDFGGGQFYDNPQLNAYFGLDAVEDVDFHDTGNGGTPTYRVTSLATERNTDLARPQFDGLSYIDYDIGFTAAGEWENYTRTYPAGTFNVYLRAARGTTGAGAMGLSQVLAGLGTSNQTTVALGTFSVPNTGGWQTYQWVPLKEANGNLKVLDLKGLGTLRLTDGGANINFLALTPALYLKAARAGVNIMLSFGTQSGFTYAVLYKNSLSDGAWSELATLAGDGSTKSVSRAMAGTGQFYRLEVH